MNQLVALACLGAAAFLIWKKLEGDGEPKPGSDRALATADANGGAISVDPTTGTIKVGNQTTVTNNYFSSTTSGGTDPNTFNPADYPPGYINSRIKNSP